MGILNCHVCGSDWGDLGLHREGTNAFQSIPTKPIFDVSNYLFGLEETEANAVRYLSCLTISPVFFAAAVYLCLSQIVVIYGSEYSRFRPRTYTILFITCDFISLILQAVGGVIADTNLTDLPMQLTGVHVMVGGLAFQVSSLLLFALLSAEYAWRVKRQKKARMTEYIHISNRKCFHCFLYCKSQNFLLEF